MTWLDEEEKEAVRAYLAAEDEPLEILGRYVLPYAVLAVPVATVLYPRLTAAFEAAAHQRAAPGTAGADSAVTGLVATSTALVTAVAVAGSAMLLAASDAAERFFSFKQVDGMGQALAVLAPGLIGYALIFQVTGFSSPPTAPGPPPTPRWRDG